MLAPDVLSTGDDESHASVFPDGHTLYFLKNTPSFDFYTIVYSELRDGKWSRPQVAPFSGHYSDADIVFTADGRRAYFVSARPVNGQSRDDMEIWTIERDARGNWGEPRHVPELSSPTDEWFPTLTADGTIYFGSDRAGWRRRHGHLARAVRQREISAARECRRAGELEGRRDRAVRLAQTSNC